MKCKKRNIISSLQYFSLLIAGILIFLFFLKQDYDFLLISALFIWISCIVYCARKFYERIIFFLLQITFFTFILSRPLIDLFRGESWIKNTYGYCVEAEPEKTVIALVISLCGLMIGGIFSNFCKSKRKIITSFSNINIHAIRIITLTVFIMSCFFELLGGIEKLLFRMQHSYVEYYILFKSELPYVVYVISTFSKYSLCFYLATKPSKRISTVLLVLYISLSVPSLIMGSRGEFVVSVLFAFFYYVYRDYCSDTKKWIGKFEKVCIVCGIPSGIFMMGYMNYVRDGVILTTNSLISVIIDFFYKQGVTFSWISCGMGVINKLPDHLCYSFGILIDYILYGTFGQMIFETKGIPSGNNIIHASVGNSLSHHLSYVVLGNEYLDGHGTGSSYLLENYVDFGCVGVFVISFIIGWSTIQIMKASKYNYCVSVLCFLMFSGVIYMPRSEFGHIFGFLTYIQFWFITLGCYLAVHILKRRYI